MFDLTTIGEGQLRLTVPSGDRLASASALRVAAACSEANVAGLLAQLGRPTSWCSVMPEGALAERVLSEFRSVGVDLTNMIRVRDGRVALYFMEPGQPPMPSQVTYDRLGTPFRSVVPEQINWDALLDTRLVFATGITAALTKNTALVVRRFIDEAADRGIDIALDVNYRSMLWSPDEAREVLAPIAAKAQVLFCSLGDASTVFGISGALDECCRKVRDAFGARHVISTDHDNSVYYVGPDGERAFPVDVVPVIDRPGAGDAFVAGTLHGYLDGDVTAGIGYGMHAARIALTHYGDLTRISPRDLNGPTMGDITR